MRILLGMAIVKGMTLQSEVTLFSSLMEMDAQHGGEIKGTAAARDIHGRSIGLGTIDHKPIQNTLISFFTAPASRLW